MILEDAYLCCVCGAGLMQIVGVVKLME